MQILKILKIIGITSSILIVGQITSAQCPKKVQYLLENTQTPCTGYLFSPEQELDVRIKVDDYDRLQKMNKIHEENSQLYEKRILLSQEQNVKLIEKLNDMRSFNTWENIALFALGAVLTGAIVANVGH